MVLNGRVLLSGTSLVWCLLNDTYYSVFPYISVICYRRIYYGIRYKIDYRYIITVTDLKHRNTSLRHLLRSSII